MRKCDVCGTVYDEWRDWAGECPTCTLKQDLKRVESEARREQERLRKGEEEASRERQRMFERQLEAIEAAREETSYEIEQAAERHERTVANADKLQAEAKTNSAYELYKADLYEEALRECMKAISLDATNIEAYRIATWVHARMGRKMEARDLVVKQIKLLKTSEYRDSHKDALQVLRAVLLKEDNKALISAYLEASKSFRLNYRGHASLPLVDELIKDGLYEDARQLFVNTTSNTTLLTHTYEIELGIHTTGTMALGNLDKYMKGVSSSSRYTIVQEFKGIAASGRFSKEVVDSVRKETLKRYEEWKPEIESELRTSAAREAEHEADSIDTETSSRLIGIAIGFMVFIGGLTLRPERLVHVTWSWGTAEGVTMFGIWMVIGMVSAWLSENISESLIRRVTRRRVEPKALASLRKSEQQLRQSIETARDI